MCDSLFSEIRFSLIYQNLLLVFFFLERDYACPRMKCSCQCVACRLVPGSSLCVVLYVNDGHQLLSRAIISVISLSMNSMHGEKDLIRADGNLALTKIVV